MILHREKRRVEARLKGNTAQFRLTAQAPLRRLRRINYAVLPPKILYDAWVVYR